MKLSLSLLMCVLLLSKPLAAQEFEHVYSGTIGPYPIIMGMECGDRNELNCQARYFYLSSLHDIELEGDVDGDSLMLGARHFSDDTATETFTLIKRTDGLYEGTWQSRGRMLPVKLSPLDLSTLHNPYDGFPAIDTMRTEQPLSYVRTAYLKLRKDSIRTFQGHRIQWISFERAHDSFIQILDGYEPQVLEKINRVLLNALLDATNGELSCTIGSEAGDWEESAAPIFFGRNVASASLFVNEFCGGAHPDFGTQYFNFNTRTGEQLDLEHITVFGKPLPTDLNRDVGEDHEIIGERIVDLLTKLYPKEMESSDTDCDYTEVSEWGYTGWYFTRTGIMLSPEIAHVAAPCRDPDWPLIPYRVLPHRRNPKYKFKIP